MTDIDDAIVSSGPLVAYAKVAVWDDILIWEPLLAWSGGWGVREW